MSTLSTTSSAGPPADPGADGSAGPGADPSTRLSRLDAVPGLRPLVVSAPFGNYVQPDGCTATLGTFTAASRPGRLWRILKTVRYYPRLRAWVNKIGLRNPGIGWVEAKVAAGKLDLADKLVSVHGFEPDDWWRLLDAVATLKPMGVELNMSCPNVGHIAWPEDLFARAVATGVPVVAKLPPVNYHLMGEQAHAAGVRAFHACNTLPVIAGGMSGEPLRPVALTAIRDLRARAWGRDALVIGGGGLREAAHVADFAAAGADVFAIGTITMNPVLLASHARVRPILKAARSASPVGVNA